MGYWTESPISVFSIGLEKDTLENHFKKARAETEYLNQNSSRSKSDSAELVHVIIDFAEKMLLHSLLTPPGQLHFITGLKKDLLCVRCSNNKTNYVISLAEGHWPGGKTASEVSSMRSAALEVILADLGEGLPSKLMIHCDNCGGHFVVLLLVDWNWNISRSTS